MIIFVTVVAFDAVCVALGLLPPRLNIGDGVLGWRPAEATGRMAPGECTEYSTGEVIHYQRNDDGVRTRLPRDLVRADTNAIKVAVTGDSHTDLCATNEQTHAGVLEADLKASGVRAIVLGYGAGRYSPLQDYLAYQTVLQAYDPSVLVMNVYTGNDFYDLLRSDDRPHFEREETGYRIAPPTWFAYDDPASPPRSRVLYGIRTAADRAGLRSLYFRLAELRRLGTENGGGIIDVLAYMRSLWHAREPGIGYPDAFSAQFLNQQLFFHYFPAAEQESLRRMRALLATARTEHPGLILVMSPIPSYELTGEQPVDPLLRATLARLPVTMDEGIAQEDRLYEALRVLSAENGWWFVDNLKALRSYRGTQRLYNDFDYHILPPASELIGEGQSKVLLRVLDSLRLPVATRERSQ